MVSDTRVLRFHRYLPAGPTENGGYRKEDLVQFYCDPPGFRTIRVRDITKIRGYIKRKKKTKR